ncbi:MAG TPA: DUF6502 family protein [Burkholderiaceae bacterium]|jgi:hypothetical protein|nr:DUF6502 family protein [Burkholderiaceae bacterium]
MEGPSDRINEALAQAVLRILHALARLLLRHGMPLRTFAELAKRAYVNIALREFAIPGRLPSISRAALLTGLTRKEVQRLANAPEELAGDGYATHSRASRVVAGWVRDADFHAANGEPAELEADAGTGSFAALVRRYGGDLPPRAVLDELMRVGAVARTGSNRLRLNARVYIPRASEVGKLMILGADVSYLINTIDHNLQDDAPRFQRKVMYDNVPLEALEEFRKLTERQAQEVIELLDAWLARHDRDVNPAVRGTGRVRAGVGVFAFEEILDQPRQAQP